MKNTHVTFTYFKTQGKYYSEGELDVPYVNDTPLAFHEILQIVRAMLEKGERPGLVNGHDFHTLVTVYTEYGPLPYLFARDRESKLL